MSAPVKIFALFVMALSALLQFGCIAHKLYQQDSLVGELFREESISSLPKDIQRSIRKECAIYEDLNDINFVLIAEDCALSQTELDKVMQQRWHIIRFYYTQSSLIREIKALMKEQCEAIQGAETLADAPVMHEINYELEINAKMEHFRESHKLYMKEAQSLLKKLEPFKDSFISKIITTRRWV